VSKDAYLKTTLAMLGTWGGWEWQHSLPPADPSRYTDDEGIQQTYPFARLYSVSSASAFDAYRTKSGLAAIRHYSLNEDSMEGKLGYFVCDVDRSGPYSMIGESRAVAFGDPDSIGYLSSHDFNRGFPEYTRAFHAAYLALPALPSKVVQTGDVTVRSIDGGKHGTYLSLVNVTLEDRKDVKVKLPIAGHVLDLVTGSEVPITDGNLTLSFYPGELKALRVTSSPVTNPSDPGTNPDPTQNPADPTPASDEASGCACDMSSRAGTSGSLLALGFVLLFIRRRR
jgi:hypothetical protein